MSELPLNTIVPGDCLGVMRGWPSGSVDLVLTDPPYGVGYHSNHYKDRNPHAPITNDWNFQIGQFFQEGYRVLRDGGAAYVFCRWDVYPIWAPYISPSKLKLKTAIVWLKDNWSAGDLEGSFGNQYEMILFLVKGRHKIRGKRWPNVWPFPRVPHTQLLHPAQKPIELLERAILASTDDGGLVVDPMCGSGSTGVACQRTGRKFFLADCDPSAVSVASGRLGLPMIAETGERRDIAPQPFVPDGDALTMYGVHPEDVALYVEQIRGNLAAVDTGVPVKEARAGQLPLFGGPA